MLRWLLRLLGFEKPEPAPQEGAAPADAPTAPDPAPARRTGAALPVAPAEVTSSKPRIVLAGNGPNRAPWKTVRPAPSLDPIVIQNFLKDRLRELAADVRHTTDRRFVERLLQQVDADQLDLPPFPDVARELDELLKQTTTDILQIARVVERDPGMVRRVWTHARSAMYSSAPRSLHHAVARVGLDALWRIGMSVCLNDTVFRVEGMQTAAESVRHHGIATAEIAAMLGGERRGSLYLAGLLHGIGELIVLQVAASKKERPPSHDILRKVADEVGTALGVLMVHSWKLDDTVVVGVGHCADPSAAPQAGQRTARIVRAASIAAHASRLAREGITLESADPVTEIQELGFDPMKALSRADAVYNELYETAGPP
jgi:HD-like signal output (HDOD) protein